MIYEWIALPTGQITASSSFQDRVLNAEPFNAFSTAPYNNMTHVLRIRKNACWTYH
jgi:hypothetical protein